MFSFVRLGRITIRQISHSTKYCARSGGEYLKIKVDMGKIQNTDTLRHIKYKQKHKGKVPPPGFIDVQVVGTGAGGAPKAVVVNMDYFRYLFNCGEGTQRIASEHKIKISKLEQVMITHYSWKNIGGLLGMALSLETINLPKIAIHGPPGVEKVVTMSRGFAQLQSIRIEKQEVSAGCYEDSAMKIEYVPLFPRELRDTIEEPAAECGKPSEEDMAVVYVCKPHEKPRMLSLERCVDLGVPRGPLFGQLKGGKTVTLENGKVITPEDVLEPADVRRNFVILEVPSEAYLEDLRRSDKLAELQEVTPEEHTELVVHLTPPHVMETPVYKEWMAKFPAVTRHFIVNESGPEIVHEGIYRLQAKLNLLHEKIFPLLPRQIDPPQDLYQKLSENIIVGQTGLRYFVRSGKLTEQAINSENCFTLDNEKYVKEAFQQEGFPEGLEAAKETLKQKNNSESQGTAAGQSAASPYPEVIFLGTGSAMPNKVRNVSSILLHLGPESWLLMDSGEGTHGQICRHFGERTPEILRNMKAIFISHLHADHHIGMCGVLEARRDAYQSAGLPCPPMLLMAPTEIHSWLDKLREHVLPPEIGIRLVSTENLCRNKQAEFVEDYNHVKEALQLQEMQTVRMWHRQHPHGLIINHQDGWKLAYSGDTTPSEFFAKAGADADLLIHEATMEDGMEEDAWNKRHCTTSQAIEVGVQMKAKFILLTHFSQRYAKIPIFSANFNDRIGIAFDNMRVRLPDLPLLPVFLPALKAMFADDYADMENKSQKRARRQEREEAEGSEAAGKKAKKERDGAEGNGKRPRGKKSKQKKNQYQPSAPDMSTQNELGTTVENKAGCQ